MTRIGRILFQDSIHGLLDKGETVMRIVDPQYCRVPASRPHPKPCVSTPSLEPPRSSPSERRKKDTERKLGLERAALQIELGHIVSFAGGMVTANTK